MTAPRGSATLRSETEMSKTLWRQDGNLVYSLNECGTNHDEIVVTMADGEHGINERTKLALKILTALSTFERLERERNALLAAVKKLLDHPSSGYGDVAILINNETRKQVRELVDSIEGKP